MSFVWYIMFVLSGSFALAIGLSHPDVYSLSAALVSAFCARAYLKMGDEEELVYPSLGRCG